MKILVNAFAAREGGGRWFTRALIQKLAELHPDWHFLVFYADQKFVEDWSILPNINLRCIPEAIGHCQRTLWQQWKLRAVVKKEKVDLIFSPLNIGVLNPPVPQVTVQGNAHHLFPKVKKEEGGKRLRKSLELMGTLASIKSSAENIFISKYMAELAGLWVKPDRKHWHVIYIAVNHERFKASPERIVDCEYILCVGALNPHKNVETLIKAFKIVSESLAQKVKLVLVGGDTKVKYKTTGTFGQYLRDLVKNYGLEERIIFYGVANGDRLISLYKHAEICVVPSFLESFGVVAAESLYCETACVVSDIQVFHEVYGDSVLYCDPHSPSQMADIVIKLFENKGLQKDLIEKGKLLLPRYHISVIAKEYANVLKNAAFQI